MQTDHPKITARECAAPERNGNRLSKTDWLDIALVSEVQPENQLSPLTKSLLARMNRIAGRQRISVCLILIGNDFLRTARSFFRFGADRIFAYDDPVFSVFNPLIYAQALQHYTTEYKPSLLIFPDTMFGRQVATASAAQLQMPVMENAAGFELRSNRDLILPGASLEDLAQITASRPQLIIAAELENRGEAIDDPERRGELVVCELPDALTKLDRISKTTKIS